MIAFSILFPAVIKLPLKPQKLIEYGKYDGFYEENAMIFRLMFKVANFLSSIFIQIAIFINIHRWFYLIIKNRNINNSHVAPRDMSLFR